MLNCHHCITSVHSTNWGNVSSRLSSELETNLSIVRKKKKIHRVVVQRASALAKSYSDGV
jgi:hypothetical protein